MVPVCGSAVEAPVAHGEHAQLGRAHRAARPPRGRHLGRARPRPPSPRSPSSASGAAPGGRSEWSIDGASGRRWRRCRGWRSWTAWWTVPATAVHLGVGMGGRSPGLCWSMRPAVRRRGDRWRQRKVRRRPGRGTDAHHSRGSPRLVMVGLAAVIVRRVLCRPCGSARHVGVGTSGGRARHGADDDTAATTAPTTVRDHRPPTTEAPAPITAPAKVTAPVPATTTTPPGAPAPPAAAARHPAGGRGIGHPGDRGERLRIRPDAATLDRLPATTRPAGTRCSARGRPDVGYAGFAPPGQKREGDGRTPSGSFGFDFFFGVLGNPGVQFPYRPVTGRNIVWDDDPSSPLYNQWVDTNTANAGAAPEPMDDAGLRLRSGDRLQHEPDGPRSGQCHLPPRLGRGGRRRGACRSRPSELLAVLRWLSPAAQPRIIMGTAATIAPWTPPAIRGVSPPSSSRREPVRP